MQGALAILEERMPQLGIVPDVMTFNAAIRSVGRSRQAELAERLVEFYHGMAKLGVQPDKYTFSALFNAAHHCGLTDGTFLLQVCACTAPMPASSLLASMHLNKCLRHAPCSLPEPRYTAMPQWPQGSPALSLHSMRRTSFIN